MKPNTEIKGHEVRLNLKFEEGLPASKIDLMSDVKTRS